MKTRAIAVVSFGLMMILFSVGITSVAANPTTKYSVVVSNAPHVPQDIWVGGSSASGTWRGGGSVCLVGGVLKAMSQVTGVPLPPGFDSSMVQFIVQSKVIAGGQVPPPFWEDDDFFLEMIPIPVVMHGIEEFFPPEMLDLLEYITKMRLTFNYMEGRNIQPVMLWFFVEDHPGLGTMWIPDVEEFPRQLMTVINTIG